jgi:tetratricopeptide (TPR) repeat protein
LNEQIPDDLNRVILKCLEKDKENRYQSAQEVRSELTNIEKGIPTTEKVDPQRKPSTSKEVTVTFSPKKVLIPAAAAVILIAASVLLWRFFLKKEAIPSVPEDKPSLAVLYFENNSGEESLDNWRSGISEMLITDLSQSKFLHTLSSDRIYSVMDRLNLMEKEKYSTEDLKKVASQGGASHVIKGSFITAGEKFIINASLMNAQTTEVISSIREEGRGEVSITDSLDKITKQIKKDLNLSEEKISRDLDKELSQITTQSPEAFKYYSQGVKLYDQQTRKSIPFFERAIKIDPEFAMAYRKLGLAYESLRLAPQAQECLEKAMELKDRVSEKERYLIEGSYYANSQNTYDKAIAAYKKLLKIYPDNTIANNNIGLLFLRVGQNEKAVYYYERARKAGTEFEGTYRNLARCYWDLGEDEKAKQVLEDYIENIEDSAGIHRVLATCYQSLGEYDRALSEVEKALSLDPNHIESINTQATIYKYKNDLKKAENSYWKLREFTEPRAGYFAKNGLCSLDLIRGKYERACSWVNKGIHKARELNIKSAQSKWQIDLAYILCQNGCYEEALSKCELAWKNAEKALINSQHVKRLALHMKSLVESDLHSLTQAQKTANKLKESIGFYYHLMSRIELEKGNYLRSIDLIHKALSEDPKNERFIQTLGLAYYKAGDLDNALKQYEKIISLTLGAIFYGDIFTKSFYMLGMICEALGEKAKAKEYYENFLNLWKDADPGIPELKEAQKRLSQLNPN